MRDDHKRASETWTRKSSRAPIPVLHGVHRFEHWYRSNQIYFISARVRDQFPAFESEPAKQVFWDRFAYWSNQYEFIPWVTSLLDNHYHRIGYNKEGEHLSEMMRRLHGSIAKLVNDILVVRHLPFWRGEDGHNYFDGCLRDETQGCKTYRYVRNQAVRHGIVRDWREYPHTKVNVQLDEAIQFALERKAFLVGVPYKRYEDRKREIRGPAS